MTDDGYERLPTDQLLEMLYEVDTNDPEAWWIYRALVERMGEVREPVEQTDGLKLLRDRDAQGRTR